MSIENLLFKEVKTELASTGSIYINNEKTKSIFLFNDFKNISEPSSARQNGEHKLNVIIVKPDYIIELLLLRDFNTSTKYWVYYQKYKQSKNSCIGEINTSFLDNH